MYKKIITGNVPFTPEEAGYEAAYLDKLNEFISYLIEEKIIQGGVYHLARHGKVFANNAIGSLDFRNKDKTILPDSIMRIASITKLFTGVAICQLMERGLLDITDTVAQHLEEFDTSMHRSITIYNLLTHTSGLLPDWGAFDIPYESELSDIIESFDGNWIKAALTGNPHKQPNTEWAYSSRCFWFLGIIIQRITGMTFEDYVMKNIVQPLGMEDTYFYVPEEKWDRVVIQTERGIPSHPRENKIYIPKSGGGLYSTVSDLFLFNSMLHNGGTLNNVRIIGRKSVENLVHNHLENSGLRNYCWGADEEAMHGLGFEVMGIRPFHNMSIGTYGHEGAGVSWTYVDPKEDFIASVFFPYYLGEFNMKAIHRSKYIIWGGIV